MPRQAERAQAGPHQGVCCGHRGEGLLGRGRDRGPGGPHGDLHNRVGAVGADGETGRRAPAAGALAPSGCEGGLSRARALGALPTLPAAGRASWDMSVPATHLVWPPAGLAAPLPTRNVHGAPCTISRLQAQVRVPEPGRFSPGPRALGQVGILHLPGADVEGLQAKPRSAEQSPGWAWKEPGRQEPGGRRGCCRPWGPSARGWRTAASGTASSPPAPASGGLFSVHRPAPGQSGRRPILRRLRSGWQVWRKAGWGQAGAVP